MIDQKIADGLKKRAQEGDSTVLRSAGLRSLFDQLKTLPPEQRAAFGQEVNSLRKELENLLGKARDDTEELTPIDVTAPFGVNIPAGERPKLLPSGQGSQHPLMTELMTVLDIFYRMGFTAVESREIDDDYH